LNQFINQARLQFDVAAQHLNIASSRFRIHQHDSTFKIGDDYRVTDAQESHSEEIFLPFDLGQSIGTVLNFTSDSAIGPIDKSEVDDGNSAEQYASRVVSMMSSHRTSS